MAEFTPIDISLRLVTSIFTTNKLPVVSLIAFVTLLASLPVATTLLPAASAAFAIFNPMPLPAPVTNHTLLSFIVFLNYNPKVKEGNAGQEYILPVKKKQITVG